MTCHQWWLWEISGPNVIFPYVPSLKDILWLIKLQVPTVRRVLGRGDFAAFEINCQMLISPLTHVVFWELCGFFHVLKHQPAVSWVFFQHLPIWRFPEIGVPLNHPFINRIVHYKPSSYWGSPMTMDPPFFGSSHPHGQMPHVASGDGHGRSAFIGKRMTVPTGWWFGPWMDYDFPFTWD